MESDENNGARKSGDDDSQVESTLGALIRIASRLESTPAVRETEDARLGKRRRLVELVAMAAAVLAASAVGVALWGQAPAKASSGVTALHTAPNSSNSPACTGSDPKLTVQGNGVATGTPDQLTLVTEVDVTESSAAAALSADNAQAGAVERALVSDGVASKNLQTTNLSIQPNYTTMNNRVTLTGYAVSDTVTANFGAPFANAGKAIDDITAIAGNDVRIDNLSFSFADPRALEDQARTNAVGQAVAHAASMAGAAGEKLGPICSVTDNTAVQPYNLQYGGYAPLATSASGAQAAPLRPGSQQETDQVTIVYALKP
jgi:uncharacterized protein YggE